MKKILSIVVMLTMVFTLVLTGCGEKKNDTVDSGTQVNDNDSNADSQEDINDTEDTDSEDELEDEQEEVADKALKVSMVTDTGGINDQSFNQLAWAGLEKAQNDLGIEAGFLESSQEADYAPNLENLYDQDTDLIWGIGYLMADAVLDAAKTNPDRKYAIIDNAYTEEQEAPDNLLGVTFSEQEPSFLVGYIAGKMTKTNKVGFVGGMEFDVIWRFESGYRAGVKTANPDAEILIQYVNAFDDTAVGKAIANGMYQNGADIIFHAAGFSGTGVIESAVENEKLVIGVDQDQKVILGKDEIITSAVKKVDQAIYNVVKDLQNGKWEGGSNINLGLADGAVGIADTSVDAVPQDLLDEVKQLEQDIIDGKITVPATREEYDELYGDK